MSTDADSDRALQTRVAVTMVLVGVLMFLNLGINFAFRRANSAGKEAIAHEDEVVAKENTEIDSRLAEAKVVVAESQTLQKQASELNERAAKIESALEGSTDKSKRAVQ